MSRLHAQLARLYALPDARCRLRPSAADGDAAWGEAVGFSAAIVERLMAGSDAAALQQVGAGGEVRVVVLEFTRSRDWPHVAALYQAVQDELGLPAPALAVRAHAGYALWFSLAKPLPRSGAVAFLDALRARYLADLPAAALTLRPDAAVDADAALLPLLPAPHAASGHWSAFIDPGLGALFADEPWLEMAPNPGQQADILAPLKSVDAAALANAREVLVASRADGTDDADATPAAILPAVTDAASAGGRRQAPRLALGGGYTDPADFLMALMNDPSASARQRIAAAKALLPYHHRRKA